jgi:hypothetical protein
MATTETEMNRDGERTGAEPFADLSDDREPRAIERDIDATRADMRATLEALERRFSMDRLIDMTVGRIRARGGEFATNLTDAATQNPMPVLLTSIGLAWMMLGSGRRDARSYDASYADDGESMMSRAGGRMRGAADKVRGAADRMRGAAGSTRETLQHAAESSREALHSATQASRETFDHTAESLRGGAESLRSGATRAAAATREHAQHARASMDRMLEEQPLMLGVFGLAAGAIIGALLPTTEQENRLLGEVRDKAVKGVAREGRARFEAAREHATMAMDAAREHATKAVEAAAGGVEDERPTSRPH